MKAFTTGPFTGRHFTVIMVLFFGVVIAVNLVMARAASTTFGGVVVENSYVASQQFNTWLNQAAKEKTLGWSATAERLADGRVAVSLNGAPVDASLSAVARHPLGRAPDRALAFARQADGRFVSASSLPAGRWRVRFDVSAAAKRWRTEQDVQ